MKSKPNTKINFKTLLEKLTSSESQNQENLVNRLKSLYCDRCSDSDIEKATPLDFEREGKPIN